MKTCSILILLWSCIYYRLLCQRHALTRHLLLRIFSLSTKFIIAEITVLISCMQSMVQLCFY